MHNALVGLFHIQSAGWVCFVVGCCQGFLGWVGVCLVLGDVVVIFVGFLFVCFLIGFLRVPVGPFIYFLLIT